MSQPVVVVAAAVVDADGRLLAARRSAPPALAGCWELPGGKVEPGESDADALRRELREELGVDVVVGAAITGEGSVGVDWPLRPGQVLRAYVCRVEAGQPAPLQDHDALLWLAPGDWEEVGWLPADRPVVRALRAVVTPPKA